MKNSVSMAELFVEVTDKHLNSSFPLDALMKPTLFLGYYIYKLTAL